MIVDAYIPSTQKSKQEDSMSVKPVQTVRILDYVGYIMKTCFKKKKQNKTITRQNKTLSLCLFLLPCILSKQTLALIIWSQVTDISSFSCFLG